LKKNHLATLVSKREKFMTFPSLLLASYPILNDENFSSSGDHRKKAVGRVIHEGLQHFDF
jgi:hypothetical protein